MACGRLPAVSLLTDLDAFLTEHRRCGDLEADVDGDIVWMACDCGARMVRRVDVTTTPANSTGALDPPPPHHPAWTAAAFC